MAMKENFISMAPDEESNAKVSLIDQNKTLMIDQYTSDVEAGNPEFVEDIHNIDDAFAHFKPKVEVAFTDEEGGSVTETLKFGEIDTDEKIRKSIEQNRKLRDILKEAGSRDELKQMLQSMLSELEGAD